MMNSIPALGTWLSGARRGVIRSRDLRIAAFLLALILPSTIAFLVSLDHSVTADSIRRSWKIAIAIKPLL